MTLTSAKTQQQFTQSFDQAWFYRTADGDYRIALIGDDLDEIAGHTDPGKPVPAATRKPLRQIVIVRVLWRPLSGAKPTHPAATNSVIDWYVMSATSDPQEDLLHYTGTGFVTVKPSDEKAYIRIRASHLHPTIVKGDVVDPIGDGSAEGVIRAQLNRVQVDEATAQIQSIRNGQTTAQVPSTAVPR